MLFFKNTLVKEKPFRAEKDVQRLVEENLDKIFGLRLVKSECIIKNKKLDTLAFDPSLRAFAIIEYKKEKTISVFDQGIAYLKLLIENKAELTAEYNERQAPLYSPTKGGRLISPDSNRKLEMRIPVNSSGITPSPLGRARVGLRRSDINWQRTRLIFAMPAFTENQLQAAEFWASLPQSREFSIELVRVKQYENGAVTIDFIKNSQPSAAAVRCKPYAATEDHLLFNRPPHIIQLYEAYRDAILSLSDEISLKPKKREAGFMLRGKIIADISLHREYIKLWINVKWGGLKDPKRLTRDVSKLRHWGNGDYELLIKDAKNLEYVIGLIKQLVISNEK